MSRYVLLFLAIVTLLIPAHAQTQQQNIKPTQFLSMVGNWSVVHDGTREVLKEDGGSWTPDTPAPLLDENAAKLFPSQPQFMTAVKASPKFPFAVADSALDFTSGELSTRFKLLGGKQDQCAGILFNLRSTGDYLVVRYNFKDKDLVLWSFKNGKRSPVKRSEKIEASMNEWHSIRVIVNGTQLSGYLNDKLLLEYTLPEPVSGKFGVWSKSDSVTQFEEFRVKQSRQ